MTFPQSYHNSSDPSSVFRHPHISSKLCSCNWSFISFLYRMLHTKIPSNIFLSPFNMIVNYTWYKLYYLCKEIYNFLTVSVINILFFPLVNILLARYYVCIVKCRRVIYILLFFAICNNFTGFNFRAKYHPIIREICIHYCRCILPPIKWLQIAK